MIQITKGVYQIPLMPGNSNNCYLAGDVLIDAGVRGSFKKILAALIDKKAIAQAFCAKAQKNNPFTTGFEKSLPSKILGEQRKVWIHIPTSNGGTGNTGKGRYPVIYLLDGDANFNDMVSITEFMSNAGICPPMIIVGTLHPARMTDFTFDADKEMPGITGNGENFMRYVKKE